MCKISTGQKAAFLSHFSGFSTRLSSGRSVDAAPRLLTFAEVDLEGQEMRLDSVRHQVLQRNQELHRFFQGILDLPNQTKPGERE